MLQRHPVVLRVLPTVIVTDLTREALAYRRFRQAALDAGFERVSENGDPLWRLHRGNWVNRQIVDVRIAPGGKELWIRVAGEIAIAYRAQRQA